MAFLYGLTAYLVSLCTLLYAVGFRQRFTDAQDHRSGTPVPLAEAIVVNILLMSLFAVQQP